MMPTRPRRPEAKSQRAAGMGTVEAAAKSGVPPDVVAITLFPIMA